MLNSSNKIILPLLKDSEKLLIWSIREWIINIMNGNDPLPKLTSGYTKFLIQEAVIPFDQLMRIISYYYCVPIDIKCHCSNLLGRTESDLLFLLSSIQNQNDFNLNQIIKISNSEKLQELIKYSTKFVEILIKAEIKFPIRYKLFEMYLNISNQNSKNIIYYDFKNKNYLK